MKKQLFFSTIFATMALFSLAQVPYISLSEPIDTSLVTTDSITVGLQQFPGSGSNWHVQPQPQKVGTTVWLERDTFHYADAYQNISIGVGNLDAASGYRIRLIIYDDAYVVTDTLEYSDVVTTKPLAQHVQILSVIPFSSLPKSGYTVAGNAIGQSAVAWGLNATTFEAMTDTFTVGFTSGFSGTLFFLFDSANMVHPSMRIYMKGLTDNWMTSSTVINGFSSPSDIAPSMTAGNSFANSDSVHVSVDITNLGNGGNPTLRFATTDDVSSITTYSTPQTITAIGSQGFGLGGLPSNHGYHISAILANSLGLADTAVFAVPTTNVSHPDVIIGSGPSGFTDYTVNAFINRHGTTDSSTTVSVHLQRSGVAIDSVLNPTSDTVIFHETGLLFNTNHTVSVKVINKANLVATSGSINVGTTPVFAPVMTAGTVVTTPNSVHVPLSVTSIGTGGGSTLAVTIKDTTGALVYQKTQPVTATGVIDIDTVLASNRWHHLNAFITSSLGLADTVSFSFQTPSPNPDGAPSFAAIFKDDAQTVRFTGITFNVSLGNSARIRFVRRDQITGIVDTVTAIYAATGTGSLAYFVINDCLGDHIYTFTIIDESQNGIVAGNTSTPQHMPSPDTPIMADNVKDEVATTATALGTKIFGSTEGNLCDLYLSLSENNIQIGTFSTPITGTFEYPHVWYGLDPDTWYGVTAQLSVHNGSFTTTPVTKYFKTDAFTGIREVTFSVNTMKATQMMRLWNLSGQLVGYGEFQNVLHLAEESGDHLFIAELYDEHGQVTQRGKLPLF